MTLSLVSSSSAIRAGARSCWPTTSVWTKHQSSFTRMWSHSCAHQLGNLPDVAQVVKRPLVEHLIQSDLSGLAMQGDPAAGFGRQIAQVFDVAFALFLEVVERILRIGVPIEIEIHLRIVRF